jgi:hypothetical protein
LLPALSIVRGTKLESRPDDGLPGGDAIVVEAEGRRDAADWPDDDPYRLLSEQPAFSEVRLKAIPYYLWNNRQPGEMAVWLRVAEPR